MTQAIFVPVHDERGSAMLYDIYVDGEWVGSKRTIQQCEDRIQISTGRLTHDRYLNLLVADMPAARAQECASSAAPAGTAGLGEQHFRKP
jgi:hypothetical protein